MPTISVIIPTRNRAGMLSQALRSAQGQLGVDVELIVVDDASTDETPALLAGLDDDRVAVVRHDAPRGVSAARNAGIEHSEGEWIAFLDDDDLWAPDKLALQLEAAASQDRRWIYAGEVEVDAGLRVLGGTRPPPPDAVVYSLHRHNSVPAGASNVVVHQDLIAAVGTFDPGLQTSEDWDLWIRLAGDGPPAWVERPLVALRLHPGAASNDMAAVLHEVEIVAARHGIPVDRARHYRWAAWTCLRAGRRFRAARYYGRAVAHGDVVSAGRAVVALVHPRVTRDRHRARPGPWAAQAERWIRDLAVE